MSALAPMIQGGEVEALGKWGLGRASGIFLKRSVTAGRTPESGFSFAFRSWPVGAVSREPLSPGAPAVPDPLPLDAENVPSREA